ncbi:MAG: prolyl oligopeptidase family serine peptidase [Dehalococcoidia bacterium]
MLLRYQLALRRSMFVHSLGGRIAMTALRGMTPEDLFRIQWINDVQLAPDGSRAAFVVTTLDETDDEYRSAVWSVRVDDGEPRRITHGPKRDTQPCFSPDGRYLAFVRDVRGKENRDARPQLWVMPTDGGEAWQLTDLANGAGRAVWSPDGSALVVSSRVTPEDGLSKEDRERHRSRGRVIERVRYKMNGEGFTYDRPPKLWRVPFAEGAVQQATPLTDGEWSDTDADWSPDGGRIAFVSARHESRDTDATRDIWVVDAAGGEPRRVTDCPGPKSSPRWSPDGGTIAFLGHEHAIGGGFNTKLWLVGVDKGEGGSETLPYRGAATDGGLRCLTGVFDHTIVDGSLSWTVDGGLRFLCQDQGAVHLYEISAEGGAPRLLVGGERQVTSYNAHGGRIAFTATSATDPAEVFLLEGGEERQLTDVNEAWKAEVHRAAPVRMLFASEDGTRVEGWLMKPFDWREGERYPVLYNIHGGPHAQSGYGFFDEFQVQAGTGYGVFYVNFRGSTGYGERFAESVNGNTGVLDEQDLMAGLDALVQAPWVDAARLGVLGGSYGGYMTSWLVGHTDRFAAACSERAVNNWLSKVGTSDIGFMQHREIGADPWEDPLHYLRRSPIFYVEQVRTPVLVMHSENDLRCPIEQGEQFYTALKLAGVETRFVRFPEENHELSRAGKPSRRVQRFEEQLAWFDRYLRAGTATTVGVGAAVR